jgi:outer membrane receptor for monomeric catechols
VKENLQRVPLAVSVISGDTLDALGSANEVDLLRNVGGLQMTSNLEGIISASADTRLRGIPGVATYFADVPRDFGGYGAYFDIESTQVLKGPARNAIRTGQCCRRGSELAAGAWKYVRRLSGRECRVIRPS